MAVSRRRAYTNISDAIALIVSSGKMITGTSFLRKWQEKLSRLSASTVFSILTMKVKPFLKKYVSVSNSDINIMHCLLMVRFFEMPFVLRDLNWCGMQRFSAAQIL